ncbi:Vacuolar protein sorting 4c [Giardia muris]|uniref:Vacuolar protein sorting 4c n=1 Tax=Giardia muris TaxID=5742 RepID=A0A4Z1T8Q5_GIAMU|nr:Vacuolar protein sorting 4c [Giardia muris]|eukprot:TNJ28959.1 Vacuolar protein sorting 4c [Giardia muris]
MDSPLQELMGRIRARKAAGSARVIDELRAFFSYVLGTGVTEESYSAATLLNSATEAEYRTYIQALVTDSQLPSIKVTGGIRGLQQTHQPFISGYLAAMTLPECTAGTSSSPAKPIPSSSGDTGEGFTFCQASDLLPVDQRPPSSSKAPKNKPDPAGNALIQELKATGVLVDLSQSRLTLGDVVGLDSAKRALQQVAYTPLRCPEVIGAEGTIYRGVLLHGCPGGGKSFLCKCLAAQLKIPYLCATASHIMSKWQGQSEKMVAALFQLAKEMAPSIILVDEIDGLLSERTDGESDSIRRVKNQFLQCLDDIEHFNTEQLNDFRTRHTEWMGGPRAAGAPKPTLKFVVFLGATNFPDAIDAAVRRRFDKRIYIDLPDINAREELIRRGLPDYLLKECPTLSHQIAEQTNNFSNSDLSLLIKDVHYVPLTKLERAEYFFLNRDDRWEVCENGAAISTSDKAEDKLIREKLVHSHYLDLDLVGHEIERPRVSAADVLQIVARSRSSISTKDIQMHLRFAEQFKSG